MLNQLLNVFEANNRMRKQDGSYTWVTVHRFDDAVEVRDTENEFPEHWVAFFDVEGNEVHERIKLDTFTRFTVTGLPGQVKVVVMNPMTCRCPDPAHNMLASITL